MYPAGLYGTTTHDLHQEVSPGYFHPQKISNSLVAFSYGVEGRAPNEKRAVACGILFLFGVAVHCSDKTQPASSDHSTDYEVRTFYLDTKMVQFLQHIFKYLVL